MSNTVLVRDKHAHKFSEIEFEIENGFYVLTFINGRELTLTESEFKERFEIVENCGQ